MVCPHKAWAANSTMTVFPAADCIFFPLDPALYDADGAAAAD
jgi:hypothetical protein